MNFFILILLLTLLVIFVYILSSLYHVRRIFRKHLRILQEQGVVEYPLPEDERGVEESFQQIEEYIETIRKVSAENRSLKEDSYRFQKELVETKDHLMSKISELHALFDVATSISHLKESGNLYESIPEAIKRYLGIEEVALFLYNEESDLLEPVSFSESLKIAFREISVKPGEGITGKVYVSGEPTYIPDISLSPDYIYSKGILRNVRSLIAVPVKKRDRPIGVFIISHQSVNAFDAETVGTVNTLVKIISIVMENTELYQYARQLAEKDSLTLLYNHGTFHLRLNYELERASRYSRPLSAVMLDIDGFKIVNDNFGHVTGDNILKMVAGVINAHTRKTDIAGRYGGDEFAILLPETDLDSALGITRRICNGLKELQVDTSSGGEIRVTASFGIASIEEGKQGGKKIVEMADSLMYKAKSRGYGNIESMKI